MFALVDFDRRGLTANTETRVRLDPVYEMTQIKGDGETHPFLSPGVGGILGQARLFTARGNPGSRQILRLGAIVAKVPPERLLELVDSFQHVEVLQEK